ncbi:J domain-containing protein [Desulfurivibrio alkaliphilus]|uniref:Heat shock protein DnaJ domain protein n=1 Tax=Desulfurivibrio alkaliphilus (strain DSM 19089 / UNIQEM U267 / AHT2) TaxID=589865 RepID=D6Z566_DESAT|nr:J domain-containing protein [Desulfurivibrio alkaliphilus]ADH84723.1 heat shock protein DnaJ domain protein [Desulfurivibrio alkaliphilus AHT 2]
MTLMLAEKDLYRACEVIFGPELDISRDFLEYLQLSGVKCAYRKRALETHPDRFAATGHLPPEHQDGLHFHDVQQAYESLRQYLEAREKGIIIPGKEPAGQRQRPAGNSCRPRTTPGRNRHSGSNQAGARSQAGSSNKQGQRSGTIHPFWDIDALYRGPLPNRRLLLGHFLYYSGVASWRNIVQALAWQRSQRPRIGEISRRYGLLNDREIAMVLNTRQANQRFGETAHALGLLTDPQLRLLIQAQKRLQRKFGEYFVAENILTREKLARLLAAYHRHNNRLFREFTGQRSFL